jgi:hypothetical protein
MSTLSSKFIIVVTKKREIALIESIIEENQDVIIDRWKTFFCK